jgi:hypothetical protein
MASIPLGYIELGDAYDRALEVLGGDGINAPFPEVASKQGQGWITYDTSAYDAAQYRVERLMRDALADGVLCAFELHPTFGPSKLTNREEWRKMSFGGLGVGTFVERLTNPGPDTEGRPVMLEVEAFHRWLSQVAGIETSLEAYSEIELKVDVAAEQRRELKRPGEQVERVLDGDRAFPGAETYATGAAGRPTSMHLILLEAERRLDCEKQVTSKKAFAAALSEWLAKDHPTAAPTTPKTITNNPRFSQMWREAQHRTQNQAQK